MLEIHADSHLDHGLTEAQIAYVLKKHETTTGFVIDTLDLPAELGVVPCRLYGPIMGDDPIVPIQAEVDYRIVPPSPVVYGMRGDRKYTSRLVRLPSRHTSKVTIIAGQHDGRACVLFTAFGGPLSPQEPGDPKLLEQIENSQAIQDSIEFWRVHALAYDETNDRIGEAMGV